MITIAIINSGLHTPFEIMPCALSYELENSKCPYTPYSYIKAEKSGDNLEKTVT